MKLWLKTCQRCVIGSVSADKHTDTAAEITYFPAECWTGVCASCRSHSLNSVGLYLLADLHPYPAAHRFTSSSALKPEWSSRPLSESPKEPGRFVATSQDVQQTLINNLSISCREFSSSASLRDISAFLLLFLNKKGWFLVEVLGCFSVLDFLVWGAEVKMFFSISPLLDAMWGEWCVSLKQMVLFCFVDAADSF